MSIHEFSVLRAPPGPAQGPFRLALQLPAALERPAQRRRQRQHVFRVLGAPIQRKIARPRGHIVRGGDDERIPIFWRGVLAPARRQRTRTAAWLASRFSGRQKNFHRLERDPVARPPASKRADPRRPCQSWNCQSSALGHPRTKRAIPSQHVRGSNDSRIETHLKRGLAREKKVRLSARIRARPLQHKLLHRHAILRHVPNSVCKQIDRRIVLPPGQVPPMNLARAHLHVEKPFPGRHIRSVPGLAPQRRVKRRLSAQPKILTASQSQQIRQRNPSPMHVDFCRLQPRGCSRNFPAHTHPARRLQRRPAAPWLRFQAKLPPPRRLLLHAAVHAG